MGSNSNGRGKEEEFEAYFRRADLDGDGQISGAEAVAFFQGSSLPKHVLAQVWTYADQRKAGYLGRREFFNALKLVTVAQSNRELTPEMVKAALHGPASSKIPAPKINLAATPSPNAVSSSPQAPGTTFSALQNTGIRPPQVPGNANPNLQHFPLQQNQLLRPPQAAHPGPAPGPRQFLANQGVPRGVTGIALAPSPPLNSNTTSAWLGGSNIHPTPQVQNGGMALPMTQDGSGLTSSGLTTTVQPIPQATTGQMLSTSQKPQDSSVASTPPASRDSTTVVASGNGFSFDSHLGNVFSGAPVESKDSSTSPASSAGSLPASSVVVPPSSQPQSSNRPSALESLQTTLPQQPVSGLSTGNQGRQLTAQSTSGIPSTSYPTGTGYLAPSQSQQPWPKMTQSDIQKYMKVFVQVDTDRDGKITGEQARNLFLSWRLPREVLKQVWDLSDQDGDSMLSLREFCVAVYLMERYREGHPLPTTLPITVSSDETLLSVTSPSNALYGVGSFRPASGLQQPQVMTGVRPTHAAAAAARPPRPRAIPHTDEKPSILQKPKILVLEKLLVDQLSEEEQNSLNSKFEEASQADKKVEDLEKGISESRQKIEFYRAKMQELILYKSRCDNRLNEVSARVSSDKREFEALAKKYEDKCKQAGDVASRLTIEEATFRDIQEKKMELYRAIVKMEEGDTIDGVLKERVEHIQSSLEELVRTLNERCKQYGLRGKPTSLVELPFGWQPGIQEGAADWDEDWDNFQDEGYAFIKELTLNVHNVVALPKTKSSLVRQEVSSPTASSSKAEIKSEKDLSVKQVSSEESAEKNENGEASSPRDSPTERREPENQRHEVRDSPFTEATAGSSRDKEVHRDGVGAESVSSGDKGIGEQRWGTFDSHYDSESVWDSSIGGQDMDHGRYIESSMFDIGEFSLNPIKTGSSEAVNTFMAKSHFTFADSVPSTPIYDQGKSIFADSVPSTPAYSQGKSPFMFADSVPSTPAYNQGKSTFAFADSVPSTPAYNQGKSAFADSVPSITAYNNSPRRFSGGSEDYSFDSFSRFDSFNMHDTGLFQSSGPSLSRFDSMCSTAESDQSYALPSRFDSYREPTDSDQNHGFSRFDSFRESNQSHSFSRFDAFRDSDLSGAFPSTFDSFGESKDSNHSHGFSRFDSFSAHGSGQFQSSDNSFARFDSSRGSIDFDNSHRFSSFDDADPFGSDGPFKSSSVEHETPRKTSDGWHF